MIRVYIKLGSTKIEGGKPEHITDPVQACARYWALVTERRPGPSAIIIHPPRGLEDIVLPARYRLDSGWSAGPREQAHERWLACWATPEDVWTPPSPTELRGLLVAAGLSQMAAGRALGVTGRTVRHWCAGQTPMSYAHWFTLRETCLRALS